VLSNIYRERVTHRGRGAEVWGWATAYKLPANTPATQGIPVPNPPATGAPAGGSKS